MSPALKKPAPSWRPASNEVRTHPPPLPDALQVQTPGFLARVSGGCCLRGDFRGDAVSEPIVHDDGIYFGLDETAYHADPALSNSGIKNLLISPLTYWVNSHLNTDWPGAPETEALATGSAFDKWLTEGREAFNEAYAVKLDQEDYPDALDGGDDLRAWLKDHDLARGGTIATMCERIQEADPDVELWPVIDREHREANADKILIKPDVAMQIAFRAGIIERHPAACKAFRGGYPQVSIFWRDPETGIRMKCRVDYLKIKATVELKTFANMMDKPLDMAIANTVAQRRYHIQAAIYLEAVDQAKRMIREGGAYVFDDAPHGWLKEFGESDDHSVVFVFLEKGAVPNLRIREFRKRRHTGEANHYWTAGHQNFRDAVELYQRCVETFGTDPWIEPEPMTPFEDEEFPIWLE